MCHCRNNCRLASFLIAIAILISDFNFLVSPSLAANSTSGGRDEDSWSSSSLKTTTGKIVLLDCGSNRRMIKWTKEGSRIPQNHRQQIHANGSLVIANVHKSDSGTFTCFSKAEKEGKDASTSPALKRSIHLRVIQSPRITPFEFPVDVMIGVKVKVMCTVSQGDPPFTFKWFKEDGSRIDGTRDSWRVETNSDYSILSNENVQVSQAGNYSCSVSNEGEEMRYTSSLRVNEPPKWVKEPKDASTIAGSEITMDCSASGSPEPNIIWKKAGDPWDLSPIYESPRFTLHANSSLQVHDASPDVDGLYFCSASNGFGSDIGKVIRLTVNEPARFVSRMKSQSVRKGNSADLECRATGDPPIDITWFKEDKMIQETESKEKKQESKRFTIRKLETEKTPKLTLSTLVIQTSDRPDGGVYKCNATNKWGHDSSFIHLIVEEVPEKPIQLQILNVSGTSVNISWIEPFDGNSAITKYVIKLTHPGRNDTLITESIASGTNASIGDLRPNTAFSATVFAINDVGWSEPSNVLMFQTLETAPSGPPTAVQAIATGPNSVKLSWKPPSEELWNGQINGYYISYLAAGSELEQFKIIEAPKKQGFKLVGPGNTVLTASSMNSESGDRLEAHLTNLLRSTRYMATIRAFNSKGKGPPSPEVSVKTLDDVPPTAPTLRIHSSTASSITLAWTFLNSLGASGVYQFILYLRKISANGEWREIPISTTEMLFAINGLECGQSYEFYMTAHNSVGKSEPSSPVIGRTQGSAASPPSHSEFFVKVGPTEVVLNLATWRPNVCPITFFSIKVRPKGQRDWLVVTPRHTIMASSNTEQQNLFFVRNLIANSGYELEVLAHSSGAGSSQSLYEFQTKSHGGVFKVKPSSADNVQKFDTSHGSASSSSSSGLITPLFVSSLILVLVLLVAFVLCSRDSFHNSRSRHDPSDGSFLPANKVPFGVAMSLKDLTSNVAMDCNSIQLHEQMAANRATYARPYDVFPMEGMTMSDTSTLRRETFRGTTFQERTLYESLVPSSNSEM